MKSFATMSLWFASDCPPRRMSVDGDERERIQTVFLISPLGGNSRSSLLQACPPRRMSVDGDERERIQTVFKISPLGGNSRSSLLQACRLCDGQGGGAIP